MSFSEKFYLYTCLITQILLYGKLVTAESIHRHTANIITTKKFSRSINSMQNQRLGMLHTFFLPQSLLNPFPYSKAHHEIQDKEANSPDRILHAFQYHAAVILKAWYCGLHWRLYSYTCDHGELQSITIDS